MKVEKSSLDLQVRSALVIFVSRASVSFVWTGSERDWEKLCIANEIWVSLWILFLEEVEK